ncbi:hypothetical protein [Embleya sp. AB8]|uniref:hypothetical protein n=1 Tax=Embleya sp. AB8 TaxID=3156304 RepID=UPI003C70D2EF
MANTTVDPWGSWFPGAMSGLLTGMGMWQREVSTGFERVAGYLAGSWDPPADADGPGYVGDGSWPALIGRIGAVALRAAAPSTGPEHRAALLGLLEVWAETVFADPTARLRIGTARADAKAVRDERGATVATSWPHDGRCAVLQVRAGDADPPEFGTPTDWVEVPRGWGDAAQLRRLVALVRERGPMPWDPAAARRLAEATGLSRAASVLVLVGDAGGIRTIKPLSTEQRRLLGLGQAEAAAGYDELRRLTEPDRLELFARALPDDPAELWEPTGPDALAGRIGAAWRDRFGRAVAAPEATIAVLAELDHVTLHTPAAQICAAFLAPDTHELTSRDHDPWLADGLGGAYCTSEEQGIRWFEEFLKAIGGALPIIYAELPAGDPVRAGLPAVVAQLRARFEHPGLLLDAGYTVGFSNSFDELRARFGDRPFVGRFPLETRSFDDGLTVATRAEPTERDPKPSTRLYFRPARYGDDERSALLRELASNGSPVRDAVDMLRGDWCTRVLDRVAGDALPVGAYESNPAASAPETVARVAKALGVGNDAAALHLQLLALERPTDRRVRLWNGWTAARHRDAAAALLDAGVVVADQRARAGRGVFLPGGWAKARKPWWPMEVWKANVLGVRLIGDQVWAARDTWQLTLPELFAHVWDLVERGAGPA